MSRTPRPTPGPQHARPRNPASAVQRVSLPTPSEPTRCPQDAVQGIPEPLAPGTPVAGKITGTGPPNRDEGSDDMRRSCLIVEDDASHLLLIGGCLEGFSFAVETASSVREATQKLRARNFGLVILDIDLPDGTGFEVQEALGPEETAPAILFVTSDDLAEDAVRAMRSGAANYIVKRPNYLEDLKTAVFDLLAADSLSPRETFERRERDTLLSALEEHRWNIAATARALGMSRGKLRGRIKALGLD